MGLEERGAAAQGDADLPRGRQQSRRFKTTCSPLPDRASLATLARAWAIY